MQFFTSCFVDVGCYTVWGCIEGPIRPLQIHSADLCGAYKQHLINVFVLYINDFMGDYLSIFLSLLCHFFIPFSDHLFLGFEEVPFLLLVLLPCTLFPRGNKDCPTAVCPRSSFLSKTGWLLELIRYYIITTGMNILDSTL